MTGIELLQEELIKRGYKKQQVEAKIVYSILDVIANSGVEFTNIRAEKEAIHAERLEFKNEQERYERTRRQWRGEILGLKKQYEELRAQIVEAETELAKFNKSLNECETAEGRDVMRKAQWFIDTVEVVSKYDNTAFINGLAAILSAGRYDATESLKQINPRLFESVNDEHTTPKAGRKL